VSGEHGDLEHRSAVAAIARGSLSVPAKPHGVAAAIANALADAAGVRIREPAADGGAGESGYRSCRSFATNAVRLQLHALDYNLGNFMRTLVMPKAAEPWSLTSLREKLIKIGTKVVSHGRYVTFQLAEVAVSREMFQDILMLIARLREPPAPA
jgi:hypothetical protein